MSDTAKHHEDNRAFYNRIASAYDWLADSNEKAARERGLSLLGPQPGEKVLELGFGTGNEVLALAEKVGKAGLVAGIDISQRMLEVTQGKLAASPPEARLDLRVGDARSLPWPDGSFDAAYTSFTLELFPEADLPVVLAEVKRVLRPGGRLAVVSMATVPQGQKPSLLEDIYVWMHRHFPHIVDCRPIDPPALLRAAGYSVEQTAEMVIWTMPVRAALGRT
jgi:demethylmenaquinone methyltransferase/2-methoxy-6-polyprenyl-1,4-benzoquinol methylase